MQNKRNNTQYRMVLLPPLEEFVSSDHRLRKLNQVLDLSFVHDSVRECYSQDRGRPSVDPEVMMRLFLLQAIEGISHVRELIRAVEENLAYRWFVGYELDEKIPDHSTLSKTLDRLGEKVFNEVFERSIAQCIKSGLVSGKILHIDATTIRADLDCSKVAENNQRCDRDARFGRFPDGKLRPGYKQHTVCDDGSRVVLGIEVTPANESEHDHTIGLVDEVLERLPEPAEVLCGDGAYASGLNCDELKDRGVELISPPPRAKTYTGDQYFTVEDFTYDETNDVFECPNGKELKYLRTEPERGRRIYRASRSDCRRCPLHSKCTRTERRQLKVTAHHAGLVELRARSRTVEFKALYSSRAPNIEGCFAEGKQWHSLGRAWRRGLSRMRVQCLLIAAVLNFKRLTSAKSPLSPLIYWNNRVCDAIWLLIITDRDTKLKLTSLQLQIDRTPHKRRKNPIFQQARLGGAILSEGYPV
jgi:transposase